MRFHLIGFVTALLLFGTVGAVAPYGSSESPKGAVGLSLPAPHDPILIEGDEDFTSLNGVTGGSGTALDPYVIEGWRIEQYPRDQRGSIDIRGTVSHFVIRNVYIENSRSGLTLENVANGFISSVTVAEAVGQWGVYLEHSRNITVTDSYVSRSMEGIRLWFSEEVRATENLLEGNRGGLGIYFSANLTIARNNIVSNREYGVYLGDSTNVSFQGNTVGWNCCSDDLIGPGLPKGTIGIRLNEAADVRVDHNDFMANQLQALDDGGSENAWDDGYRKDDGRLSGGNYWSNVLGVDECSGAGQDVCDGGDGFLDAPYVVDSNTIDRYPLQVPNDPSNQADTPLPGLPIAGIVVSAAVAVVLLVFLFFRHRRAENHEKETRRKEGEGNGR